MPFRRRSTVLKGIQMSRAANVCLDLLDGQTVVFKPQFPTQGNATCLCLEIKDIDDVVNLYLTRDTLDILLAMLEEF